MKQEIKVLDHQRLERKVGVVVGTRPGIVMFAPIIHALRDAGIPQIVIHAGQHYSPVMDADLFRDLNLPQPDHKVEGVGEKRTHAGQTGVMMEGIERALLTERPKLVLVGGDANTNLAGALAARKLRIQVGHVEAGERSFDWRMPEEHNRRIIDHISEHLFATGEIGKGHLEHEAVQGRIYVVGNPIVDASLQHLEIARQKSDALRRLGLTPGSYLLMTSHREENVDFAENLRGVIEGVSQASQRLGRPAIFLAHPRTRKRLEEFELLDWAQAQPGIRLTEPVAYLDFLNLIAHAHLVFTDSGGVQQEACIHHVPAITLRENTEWVDTLKHGANRLAGTDPQRILAAAIEADGVAREWGAPFGDGTTAVQIATIVKDILASDGNPLF